MGSSNLTYGTTQDVTIIYGRRTVFEIKGNQITTDGTTRSLTIVKGRLHKYP